ncbi:hypothetical protein HYU15_02820 [Candidatus Woesearchaeota archaeon]|nr:hypothetical protein [Candidatus Woesearchaeota archaeon]
MWSKKLSYSGGAKSLGTYLGKETVDNEGHYLLDLPHKPIKAAKEKITRGNNNIYIQISQKTTLVVTAIFQ